ncbi:hypothetical protein PILCRDRAFT_8339 [Piloderma croceum F 1598]|uniref:Uncharacterized protein n=1 Tax=Piloderma croceum (strain F 1598) TaxID=765440 RepID=A0A0C3FTG8_PILCF|nr:hypothetical protein PILCRDRAFT_8339 [Piloderma croceum F 1598]
MWEGTIAENDVIKHKVRLLRQLVEKLAAMRDGEREEWGLGGATGVLGLESVEEDEEQMARQEQQHKHKQKRRERWRWKGGDDGSNSLNLGHLSQGAWR